MTFYLPEITNYIICHKLQLAPYAYTQTKYSNDNLSDLSMSCFIFGLKYFKRFRNEFGHTCTPHVSLNLTLVGAMFSFVLVFDNLLRVFHLRDLPAVNLHLTILCIPQTLGTLRQLEYNRENIAQNVCTHV